MANEIRNIKRPRSLSKMEVGAIAAVAFLVLFFGSFIGLLSDWLWFGSVGYLEVFKTRIFLQVLWGILFFALFFGVLWLNSALTFNLYGKLPQLVEDGTIIRLPGYYSALRRGLAVFLSLLLALWAGTDAAANWELFARLFNGQPFSVFDPVFRRDIGFYIFELPALVYIFRQVLVLLLACIAMTGAVYFFSRGAAGIPRNFDLPFRPKFHLCALICLLFIAAGFLFYFFRYGYLSSPLGMVEGALYTDVHARIPFLTWFAVLTALGGFAAFLDLRSKCWKYTSGTASFLISIFLLGMLVYPFAVQKFFVLPNELSKEQPYLQHNIDFTRRAFGIEDFKEQEYPERGDLTYRDIEQNRSTLENIRLWDYKPLLDTYAELQEIRTYYDFYDVDYDRYMVDGKYRQIMLSGRELSRKSIPDKKWINETFIYTHGYGVCLSPVNQFTSDGLPEFFIKDIPPVSIPDFRLQRPEIYYGELTDSYSIVRTKIREFDYPAGDNNVYTTYEGTGGVPVNNFWRKLLFSIRFQEMKIFFSGETTPESKILYHRRVRESLDKVAPFIRYDEDPYLVIHDGRLKWIVDGYTVAYNYPYSQSFRGEFNYIRNSVKAVVDAYNGTMDFYAADTEDPVLACYGQLFRGLFKPMEQMPEGLRRHIRYPEDLFVVQSEKYTVYHMTDTQVFYNQEDRWKIPSKYKGNSLGDSSSFSQQEDMSPYYTIFTLPEPLGSKEEFVLMLPFTPARKSNLIGLMAARCDAPHYGEVVVYTLPKDKLVYGPGQIDSRIDQDSEISKQLTLWTQGGSNVIRGNLLVIPVEDSLLYIEPLYLAADSGKIPQLKKVFVVYGNTVVMEDTLDLALRKVFLPGGEVPAQTGEPPPDGASAPSAVSDETVRTLIEKADGHFMRAKQYQRDDDWAGYGREMESLRDVLNQMKEKTKES